MEKAAAGRDLYAAWCAGCHGEKGDGNGLADSKLVAPPRDLTTGKFKVRTTETKNPISRAELFETLTRGMPDSAMPAFGFLSEAERRDLVEYVAVLAALPGEEIVQTVPVPEQPTTTDGLRAKGAEVYRNLGCPVCHGDEGGGDGPASSALKDVWGNMTPARDLTREGFRGGDQPRDLYLRFAVGMPGTPMPSYRDVATPEELWALVAYVRSLRIELGPPPEDPVAWGALVVEEKFCTACHLLGGGGGRIGPNLDVAARKLRTGWMETYLVDPVSSPKLYPAVPWRMPNLGLTAGEARAVAAFLSARKAAASLPEAPPPAQQSSCR